MRAHASYYYQESYLNKLNAIKSVVEGQIFQGNYCQWL